MLTIDNVIGIICLCATFYSLGYGRGKHDAKTENNRHGCTDGSENL